MDFTSLNLTYLIILLAVTLCKVSVIDGVDSDDDLDCERIILDKMRRPKMNENKKIFLITTEDDQQIKLNKKFKRWALLLGVQIKNLSVSSFPSCLQHDDITITRLAAKYGTVINLRAKLVLPKDNAYIFKTFDDFTLIGQSVFGEIENETVKVCNSTVDYKTINGENYETCDEVSTVLYVQTAYIKVISKSLEKYTPLVKMIKSIEAQDEKYDMYWKKYVEIYKRVRTRVILKEKESIIPCDKEYILVCGLHENMKQTYTLSDRILCLNDCTRLNVFSKVDIEVLAVIAARPLDNEDFNDFPIIFYDTPRITEEYSSNYPNSMVLFDNYFQLLAKGFLTLAKQMPWNRIAIISDYAEDSIEFEDIIVEAFRKSDVLYTVKSCLKKKCEFKEALEYFKEQYVKIIIANVEEKHVQQVMETAAKLELTSNAGIIWIFRDLLFDYRTGSHNMDNTYTMKLVPAIPKPGEMHLDSIAAAAAVSVVTETLKIYPAEAVNKSIDSIDDTGSRFALRSYYKYIWLKNLTKTYEKMRLQTYSEDFQLHKLVNGQRHVIYSYNFKNKNRSIHDLNQLDIATPCYFSGHKFEYPCYDSLLLITVLVLLGLLLTVLVLFEFFKTFTRNGIRYRKF